MKMARSLGTGNAITPGYVCHSPRLGLYGLVTGYGRLYCDYHGWGGEFPKTQISWAKQLEISSADSEMAYWFLNSLDYAKNLIIIDPRASAYASRATLWIQPRVGTDCALAMGMMNHIIEKELWDKEFVRRLDLRVRRAPRARPGLHAREGLGHLLDPQGTRDAGRRNCGPSTRRAASRSAARSSARPTAATRCAPSPA